MNEYMSDMNEHIDKLIKQAADDAPAPLFNEEAWNKMDVMLDKEFGKKKRRGFIWFWFAAGLLIAGGGGTYLMLKKNNALENKVVADKTTNNTNSTETLANDLSGKKQSQIKANDNNSLETNNSSTTTIGSSNQSQNIVVEKKINNSKNSSIQKNTTVTKTTKQTNSSSIVAGNKQTQTSTQVNNSSISNGVIAGKVDHSNANQEIDNTNLSEKKSDAAITSSNNEKSSKLNADSNSISNKVNDTLAKKTDTTNTTKETKKKKKDSTPLNSKFYVLGSVAADASFVDISKIEKVAAVYGVGVGYQLNNRLSFQTGVYAGKKVYLAGKEDYDFSKTNYPPVYINSITNIDADCYVIEIPVTVRYNIIAQEKNKFFGTAGLSSFIMKSENYKITSYYNSNYYTSSYQYDNQNKHFFSILDISLGYERKLTNKLAFIAEAYYKLPLGGVGQGQVKLSSIGLQLGVKYNLPKKKK